MVKIIVKNTAGEEIAKFTATDDEALGTQIQDAGIPIPFSCGAGACRTCCCQVTKGLEHIDKEAVGPMHIMVDDEEILSCIAGLKVGTDPNAEIEMVAENT